jgi:hypothetical protein
MPGSFTDVAQWRFVFASKRLRCIINKLKLVEKLDDKLGTPKVYIVDKERNLRGRKLFKEQRGIQYVSPSLSKGNELDDFQNHFV